MEIIELLEMVKNEIQLIDPLAKEYLVSKGNDNGFEKLVPTILEKIVENLTDDVKIIVHYGHHFPDMDIILNGERFGLELKSRSNGSWETNGNSVFESISKEEYKEIYLLFGSKERGKEHLLVRYAPYWKTTSTINVTHSPRFKINMDTKHSVFESQSDYNKLRSMTEEEKILFLQNYLRQNTDGAKWFISPKTEDSKNELIRPISLNTLDKRVKSKVISEVLVLFPQDLLRVYNGKVHSDYARSSEYLILTYFYYSSSFRDFFSAGGKWRLNGALFPQIIKRIFENRTMIKKILNDSSDGFKEACYDSWDELELPFARTSFFSDYKRVLDYLGVISVADSLNEAKISKLSDLLDC